eukprot:m.331361 g.331361  ORF g.331361 m.331361 type:complete len:89 (+) comp16053_c1_seq16:252-518(+)
MDGWLYYVALRVDGKNTRNLPVLTMLVSNLQDQPLCRFTLALYVANCGRKNNQISVSACEYRVIESGIVWCGMALPVVAVCLQESQTN